MSIMFSYVYVFVYSPLLIFLDSGHVLEYFILLLMSHVFFKPQVVMQLHWDIYLQTSWDSIILNILLFVALEGLLYRSDPPPLSLDHFQNNLTVPIHHVIHYLCVDC